MFKPFELNSKPLIKIQNPNLAAQYFTFVVLAPNCFPSAHLPLKPTLLCSNSGPASFVQSIYNFGPTLACESPSPPSSHQNSAALRLRPCRRTALPLTHLPHLLRSREMVPIVSPPVPLPILENNAFKNRPCQPLSPVCSPSASGLYKKRVESPLRSASSPLLFLHHSTALLCLGRLTAEDRTAAAFVACCPAIPHCLATHHHCGELCHGLLSLHVQPWRENTHQSAHTANADELRHSRRLLVYGRPVDWHLFLVHGPMDPVHIVF
jgi:hypothetical protein